MKSLKPYREKWREVPGGDDVDSRVFSDDLLRLPDDLFLTQWDSIAARRAAGVVGRMEPLYRDYFSNRRVLELGGGLGFDGMRFAQQGAQWTFADIVPGNLDVIRRAASLKGIAIQCHLIGEDLSFEALPPNFDAIVVIGSIHHVPFDIARKEALSAISRLKVGGRWIELVYPRERWLREGSMPFDTWGTRTDGDRTPWVEWHDVEKVRRRLHPAILKTVLDFELASHSHRWLDLEYAGMGRNTDLTKFVDLIGHPVDLDGGERDGATFYGPKGAFHPICRIDLRPLLTKLSSPYAVELILDINTGVVGAGLVDANNRYLADTEVILEAAADHRSVTIRCSEVPTFLVFRNRHETRGCSFVVRSARLREA
ncbi:MAG: class I SAM-dependent methyltransferase [Reyranella sp.]|nr:class I SAM-dependent methyltransferase [Reyranella sp.]